MFVGEFNSETLKFYIYETYEDSKFFFKLLGELLVLFLLNSCGSQYHLASYYDNDPIYGVTKSGDSIRIDVIENDFEFSRKVEI